jgi:hypothetical protein
METDSNHGVGGRPEYLQYGPQSVAERALSPTDSGRAKKQHPIARAIALSLVAIFFVTITLFGVVAAPLIITAPASVSEGQPLVVNASGPGMLSIARDGVVVATGAGSTSDILATTSASAGVYAYTFSTDAAGVAPEGRTIEVTDVPLAVTPVTPATTDLTTNEIIFSLSSNWEPDLCYVNIDDVSHTLARSGDKAFSGAFSVSDGVHTIDYKCRLGTEISSSSKTIHVDASPPIIIGALPTGDVTGPFVTLAIDTNEIALCRFGTADASFESLPASMGETYALHNTAVFRIDQEGPATFFVRCKDISDNAMLSSAIISFNNRIAPVAHVTIDGSEPLKAGTFLLKLETSIALNGPPTVSYSMPQSGKSGTIALNSDGDRWTGYLVVPENVPDTVVNLGFSGTSTRGVVGTTIAQGASFTMDAMPPPPIESVTVQNDSDGIALSWYSDDMSDYSSYKIYRSTQEGVNTADYYATTTNSLFTDVNTHASRYYYYRISPIDPAGNAGQLSMEVYGTSIDSQLAGDAVVAGDPASIARLDDEIAATTSVLLDANATVYALEQDAIPAEIQIIQDMHLVDNGREAILLLEQALRQLEETRARSPSSADVDIAIANARASVAQARPMLIRRVTPIQSIEVKQPSDPDELRRQAPFAILGSTFDETQLQEYIALATKLQDRTTITLSATVFRLYDVSGGDIEYTFVRKRITMQDPANDILVIESIPKTVAQSTDDLQFSGEPTVLQNDPVVEYSYPVLQQEDFTYTLKRAVSLDEVKKSRTLLYPKPTVMATAPVQDTASAANSAPLATGFATRFDLPYLPSTGTDLLLVIFGIIVIIALGAYYISLSSEPSPFKGIPEVGVRPPARSIALRRQSQHRVSPLTSTQRTSMAAARITTRQLDATVILPRESRVSSAITLQQENASSAALSSPADLLTTAERMIDEKSYDFALSAYKNALRRLHDDEGLAQMLHDDIVRVYAKLMLYKHLDEARASVQLKDPRSLRLTLDRARDFAQQIGEQQSPLIVDAKSAFSEFANQLNSLEIERAGRY